MKPYDEDIKKLNKEKILLTKMIIIQVKIKLIFFISELFHKIDKLNEKMKLYLNIPIIWI